MRFYRFMRGLIRPICFVLMPRKYHNTENIPQSGPLIICANHISYVDPILVGMKIKHPIRFIAKQEAMNAPVIGRVLRWLGAFPVDREGKDLKAVRTCISIVKDGGVLGIFPEGTRIIKGRISEAKAGVALIAKRSKAPLLMVHIKPKKGKFKLFRRTNVYFSDPVCYDDLCADLDYNEASKKILNTIYSLGE